MIDILIFSKDRACQLDLLLQSFCLNIKETEYGNIHIICKGSSDDFNKGYCKLYNKFPKFDWKAETNLVLNIKETIDSFRNPFSLLFVDDEVIKKGEDLSLLTEQLEKDSDIHTASLRLGLNIGEYCYTADKQMIKPEFNKLSDSVYEWDWTKGDQDVDWYYPSCINSHIYRTDFLKYRIDKLPFMTVNQLEGFLHARRQSFKPKMICFKESRTLNIANNLTQSGSNRHSNKQEYSLEELNRKYLEGYCIDEKDFVNLDNDVATFEMKYNFLRSE